MASTTEQQVSVFKRYGLFVALAALALIALMPAQAGLPVAGQYMIGILVFAVIIWMTEAVSYPVSAFIITVLMTLLLGFAPGVADPSKLLGTSRALSMALAGFSNTAWALVGAALFLSAAMTKTGLDKRIALVVMSKVGARSNRILMGVIFLGFLLSFFIPSTTARVACMVPIVMGVIIALKVPLKSRFAGALMIAVAQADSLWNVGVKTAAAQNMVAVSFIEKQLGVTISWLEWFIAAAPFAAVMSVILYYVLTRMMPAEQVEFSGGQDTIVKELAALGPMRPEEKKLMLISVALLFFWATEKIVHNLDTSTTTIVAIMLMFLPGIGIMNWEDCEKRIPWGTLLLFGIGISLGSAILSTKAGAWLANYIVAIFGLETASAIGVLAILAAFLIIIHLGFASATGLAAAMIPIVIAVLQNIKTPGINVVGMTMILQYVISFGFILPVNAPQNMIAYGTGTFEVRDFVRTGVPLTIAAYLLILLMGATYWRWLGYVG